MANWMGGRLVTANYAALNESEREKKRAEDSRRRRAMERREAEEADREREPQPRGALSRVIQPTEQHQQQSRRKRRRRGGEETAFMDRFTTTADRGSDRMRRDTQRGRDRRRAEEREREDSRERGEDRDDTRRRQGGERGRGVSRREEYDGFEERRDRRQPRLSQHLADEKAEGGWDEAEDRETVRRHARRRRSRGDENYRYEQESAVFEQSAPRRRRRRSLSPYAPRSEDDNDEPHPPGAPAQSTSYLRQPQYSSRPAVERPDYGRGNRRLELLEPPPLNAYRRAQLEKQQREQQRRLVGLERSRLDPMRQAEEEARREFLSRRRRSPTFVLDPPPHLIQPLDPPRHTQQLQQRRADSPLPAYPPTLPVRPAALQPVRTAQRREAVRYADFSGQVVRARPTSYPLPRRPPALRTPSPPRTPVPLRTTGMRLVDERAFFHRRHLEPEYSAMNHELTAAGRSTHCPVPWMQQPIFHVPPMRPPALFVPPLLRLPAVEAPTARRFVATSAAVDLIPSPESPSVFRPEPAPHMRGNKLDGGRAAVGMAATAQQVEARKEGDSDNNNHTNKEHEVKEQAVDVEMAVESEKQQQQQERSEQKQDDRSCATPQPAQQTASLPAGQQGDDKTETGAAGEQPVRSSADIERALAHCDSEEPGTEQKKQSAKTTEAEETDQQRQTTLPVSLPQQPQQPPPSSPIIDVEAEAEAAEQQDEAADRPQSQSDADSAVSSHYAFVGPTKYGDSTLVLQILTDNGIHLVDFHDERCNIAFVECDYTAAQLSAQSMAVSKEAEVIFYDTQYIRDTAVGSAREISEYRLSKPSERR